MMNEIGKTHFDVAIVGAGIVGCSIALYLARRGAKVVVVDRGPISGEQSSRAWGFVRQQGRHPAELPLARLACKLWDEITEEFGIAATRHVKSGVLLPAETADDEAMVSRAYRTASEQGLTCQILSKRELSKQLPEMAGDWRCALSTAGDGHADPEISTRTIAKAATSSGVQFMLDDPVVGFIEKGGSIKGLKTRTTTIHCGTVVIAAGIGSRRLLKPLGINPPIQVIRSSVAETTPVSPFTNFAMWGPKVAFRPKPDGSFVLGNGYRGAGTDYDLTLNSLSNLKYFLPAFRRNHKLLRLTLSSDLFRSITDLVAGDSRFRALAEPKVNHNKIQHNLEAFRQLFPQLGELSIRKSWAGRLDITPDLIPVIDRLSHDQSLFAACGFSGHGFALGPAIGQLLSAWILDGASPVDLSKFRYGRFEDGSFEIADAV